MNRIAKSWWRIAVGAGAIALLLALNFYKPNRDYLSLKNATRDVPADMVMIEYLPANTKNVKLKLIATERDDRPLKIYWLDNDSTGNEIDIERGKVGVLCKNGDLASGAEFVLMPGHYRLCFELSDEGLKKNARPFQVTYSLFEHR